MAEAVVIESLGHRGDGIARTTGGPVYVPFALPGERVLIERTGERGRLLEVLAPSPERAAPPCPHFGICGGCQLQTMTLAATRALKRRFVLDALARESVDADVAETVGFTVASRRRAVLTAMKLADRVLLGFNERQSNRLVDLAACPVLAPGMVSRMPAVRRLVAPCLTPKKPARLTMLATESGLDLALDQGSRPGPRRLAEMIATAQEAGVARFAIAGEPVVTIVEPVLRVAGVAVTPPPGAFVQASTEAERAMSDLVVGHLAGAKAVIDLFAGFGTFSLALASFAQVTAVDSFGPALEALAAATRQAAGLRPVKTERRDLFAFPYSEGELSRFDAAVFDPPRAGAKDQAARLAKARLGRIAAVSCNPASFARDARILIGGGFALDQVVPVDQFVYSAEVEVVGLFSRP
ncbi:class I SAM-dependent RNA methyltransferase [Faunimonas sp. B44]|uniref:class I SAM-dependent RNA methyltransferase n=1 Tax=Faunimonas sp. B44 TaxID=3461493 RepID=UPI0040447547